MLRHEGFARQGINSAKLVVTTAGDAADPNDAGGRAGGGRGRGKGKRKGGGAARAAEAPSAPAPAAFDEPPQQHQAAPVDEADAPPAAKKRKRPSRL